MKKLKHSGRSSRVSEKTIERCLGAEKTSAKTKVKGCPLTVLALRGFCAQQLRSGGTSAFRTTTNELVMTTSSPKQLTFLWDSWFGTSLYDVQCSEDGTERMADYADAINCTGNTETVDIPVHLTNWGTCQFSVVAHNEANNLRLSYQPVTFARSDTNWSQKSYVKASNAEAADAFGTSLSISADGTSLVVGANYEGSSATGVDGDQTNNGASHAGAVYLY